MNIGALSSAVLSGLFRFYKSCVRVKTKYAHRRVAYRWCRHNTHSLTAAQLEQAEQYWKKYTRAYNVAFNKRFSTVNGRFDVRYIPEDLYFNYIEPYLNDHGQTFGNKSYFPLLFDCKMPEIAFHRVGGVYLDSRYKLITAQQAAALCADFESVIFKPSVDSCGGKNIRIYDAGDPAAIEGAIRDYASMPYYVVQNVVRQHPQLAVIHASSINTIRIMTLLSGGAVHVLPPVLRMGVGGSRIDNASSGGIVCGIGPDGRLMDRAFSSKGVQFDRHPQGGPFGAHVIPSVDGAKALAARLAERYPAHRLIAWDIAIGEDGEPILIEANFSHGQIDFFQFINGPLFGDHTDDVLDAVFGRT